MTEQSIRCCRNARREPDHRPASCHVYPLALRPIVPSAPTKIDDDDVAHLVRNGDLKQALRRLMQCHGASVYRYCRMALGDPALADDVHQQVFVDAFRDLPRFAGRSKVRTWLFGIARHRVLDAARHRRWSRSHHDDDADVEPADPRPLPPDWLDDARLHAAMIACVDELDEPTRTNVLLRYQQGLSYEEMAEISGENPGTLQTRVARALRRLRDLIEKRMG